MLNKVWCMMWLLILTALTTYTDGFDAARPYAAAVFVILAMMPDKKED